MGEYSLGIDYGTLSARAVLLDLETAKETAVSEFVYPHKVFEMKLGKDAALQHPKDYTDAMEFLCRDILDKTKTDPQEIVGVGIDFTSCTLLPVTEDLTPLCFLEEFKDDPNAYVKLWKHHTPNPYADLMTGVAKKTDQEWLQTYGGKVSSEWMIPKILETKDKAPEVFDKTFRFIEAGEWITSFLCGKEIHSSCMAGYKGMWDKKKGYPNNSYFEKIGLQGIVGDKISEDILPTCSKCGEITEAGAKLSGLKVGTAVTVPIIDAHSSLLAAGIADEGKMMLIIGTSSCHIMLSKKRKDVKGICGRVEDGIIPGFFAYEAGQCCVGDGFSWFVNNNVPQSYHAEAKEKEISIFDLLDQKISDMPSASTGLLALDWLGGNRSPYADYDLTGAIFGLNPKTKPEEMYMALIESTAFGTKRIIDIFAQNGIEIKELYASGGISKKNKKLMQIYADVCGAPIKVLSTSQAGALGVAIAAAVAGGSFEDFGSAAETLADKGETVYYPDEESHNRYSKLYSEYVKLSEYFAKENDVLKKLKEKTYEIF